MDKELRDLCVNVKEKIEKRSYEEAYHFIINAMKDYPDSGVPHNLLGIWEEKQGDHVGAMKHFRVAWALEPTLLSARWNLDVYGMNSWMKECAYLDEDVPQRPVKPQYKCVYDEKGIGHMVRREEV